MSRPQTPRDDHARHQADGGHAAGSAMPADGGFAKGRGGSGVRDDGGNEAVDNAANDNAQRQAADGKAGPFAATLANWRPGTGDVVDELRRHTVRLSPLTKRRIFDSFDGVPSGLKLGWAQLPATRGRGFSLGVFTDRNHFAQIALADSKGRVFVNDDPSADTHVLEPKFLFAKENDITLPASKRPAGTRGRLTGWGQVRAELAKLSGLARRGGNGHDGQNGRGARTIRSAEENGPLMVDAVTGGVIGRDNSGRLTWLASWTKIDDRYALEQMRADLPETMRVGLGYHDAVTVAFFAGYMLPRMRGLLIGFGAGNIFRRLGREAPIGAIRRSVRDTLEARAHGMRVSGLEDHFADLMREAGALDSTPGLTAVHGAEPLHLYTSSYSGCYFFSWNAQMGYEPALQSLKIEGNLNRFAAVSAWLERNARNGLTPTEDTVTRAEAAQLDLALLTNPAILALKPEDTPGEPFDPVHDDGTQAAWRLVAAAGKVAGLTAGAAPADISDDGKNGNDMASADTASSNGAGGSEWVYRQTMATLLRRLRLPYRFDTEFRADLKRGNVGLAVTAAGASLMPDSRYDETSHGWKALSKDDKAVMSRDYNLRVGLMMVALGFGADRRVRRISLHIDSIGLEEAMAEQDSAISEFMGEALDAFERMAMGTMGEAAKGDPKDGDYHGDPSRSLAAVTGMGTDGAATDAADTPDAPGASGGDADGDGEGDASASAGTGTNGRDDGIDRQFEDLMKGIDIDETMFAMPGENVPFAQTMGGGESDLTGALPGETADRGDGGETADGEASQSGADDPMGALKPSPTMRHLVTVTFEREAFLERLKRDGLNRPVDTYRHFAAMMAIDEHGGLAPVEADTDLRDARFSPLGSQEEPELSDRTLDGRAARILGATHATGLSIQRADLLQRAVADFHRLAADTSKASVDKAREAMRIVRRIGDPELDELAPQATSALIDGHDTPDFTYTLSDELDRGRAKVRDLLFSGQTQAAFDAAEELLGRYDAIFAGRAASDGEGAVVPRYFNSYAERVVYNRLFATPGETTLLIPDNLFYAHMELADVLSQLKGVKAALPHLNAMVSYAPAYPLSHLRLAAQLARGEDWDSARAACLNALRVALDRDDAAYAYYRLAYAEWMQDRFDTAAASYIMADHIAPGQIGVLEGELQELVARADSQCVPVPESVDEAAAVLERHGLPVWPRTEVAAIVRQAARVSVDEGMFVPARTLAMAAARMDDTDGDGVDVVQAQFLRSLNA